MFNLEQFFSILNTKNMCLFWQIFSKSIKIPGVSLWASLEMCLVHHFNLEFSLSFMDIALLSFSVSSCVNFGTLIFFKKTVHISHKLLNWLN